MLLISCFMFPDFYVMLVSRGHIRYVDRFQALWFTKKLSGLQYGYCVFMGKLYYLLFVMEVLAFHC